MWLPMWGRNRKKKKNKKKEILVAHPIFSPYGMHNYDPVQLPIAGLYNCL